MSDNDILQELLQSHKWIVTYKMFDISAEIQHGKKRVQANELLKKFTQKVNNGSEFYFVALQRGT